VCDVRVDLYSARSASSCTYGIGVRENLELRHPHDDCAFANVDGIAIYQITKYHGLRLYATKPASSLGYITFPHAVHHVGAIITKM